MLQFSSLMVCDGPSTMSYVLRISHICLPCPKCLIGTNVVSRHFKFEFGVSKFQSANHSYQVVNPLLFCTRSRGPCEHLHKTHLHTRLCPQLYPQSSHEHTLGSLVLPHFPRQRNRVNNIDLVGSLRFPQDPPCISQHFCPHESFLCCLQSLDQSGPIMKLNFESQLVEHAHPK